jgi:hypothetical protein
VTSSFGIDAVQPELEALADATADANGVAGDIVQLATQVIGGMRFGVPHLDDPGDDDGSDIDPDEWVAVDNSGELVVVGPEFLMTADADGTSATIMRGSLAWSLFKTDDDDQSWHVTALDGGKVAVDVTITGGHEIDHRDTEAIADELEQHMREIEDAAIDFEERVNDAAESGQSTSVVTPGERDDVGATASPIAAGGDDSRPGVGEALAGAAGTMAAGAVASAARHALFGRSEAPPPPAPPAPAWRRTHIVPAQGISAWPVPDGRVAPVATLASGVQLQLVQVQGPWAQVAGSNGWTGWVDHALLLPAPPT